MNESNQITSWIERAEEDYIMARSALRRKTPLVRSACFHAQQCAEKYFKAVLVQRNISFPKTHDLLMLFSLCEEEGIIVPIDPKLLNTLNDYSVLVRYPGEPPTLEDARDAYNISRVVRRFVRNLLISK